MDKIKAINKVKKILSKHNLYKVNTYLSLLSFDDAYQWILWLLRLYHNYDISTVQWDSLIENYPKEINLLETEIEQFRSQRTSYNKGQNNNGEKYLYKRINDDLIHLAIEDYYLHPLLRNFRNDDRNQEKLLLLKNKPDTHSQRIAQLKSLIRYYQNRKKEIEAISEFSTVPEQVTIEIISKIFSLVPDWKSKIGEGKTRGGEKGKPSYELTDKLIEDCLNDDYYFNDDGEPVAYRIANNIQVRLNKIFNGKHDKMLDKLEESPDFKETLEDGGARYRVNKYLKENGFK